MSPHRGPLPAGSEILVTPLPLSLDRALAAIGAAAGPLPAPARDPETGAIVTFSGTVRAGEDGRTISHLAYEHYEGMAQQQMRRLLEEAALRWPILAAALHHRTGPVPVGEASVIVAVAASHRAEAFEAARFLIDELKARVPIWKAAPPA